LYALTPGPSPITIIFLKLNGRGERKVARKYNELVVMFFVRYNIGKLVLKFREEVKDQFPA
jgi:hypothetical protein